jgi:hypothetical protein
MTNGQKVTIKAGYGAKVELYGQFNDFTRFKDDTPAEVEQVLKNGDVILCAQVGGKPARIMTIPAAIAN